MSPAVKAFFQRWIVTTLAVLLAGYLVSGIHAITLLDWCVASLLLGILNAFLRPLLLWLSLPLLIFTLGLFTLVINGLLLYFVGVLLRPRFQVDDFSAAFWGALVISLVSLPLNALTGGSRVQVRRGGPPKPPPGDGPGNGPVIDV